MKKKVLLLIPGLEFGGAQKSLTRLSLLLSEHMEVYLVVFNVDAGVAFDYGGKLISLDIPGGKNVVEKIHNFFLRCHRVRKIKKENGIDVTISYMDGANFVNILSKKKDRVIISIRGSQFYDETIKGLIGFLRLRILIPFLYTLADKIVALNKGIEEELLSLRTIRSNKISVIPNYYDVAEINKMAAEDLPERFKHIFDHPVIITAGRLAPEKGYQYLLEIFADLVKNRRDCLHLVILGDGVFKDRLIAKAQELKIPYCHEWKDPVNTIEYPDKSTLYFLGYQENPYQFLRISTIFTLTSSSEGGPNILSEAMVCGIPVVSVDCPSGPREQLSLKPNPCLPILKAEYAEYGVLMPMLNDPSQRINNIKEWVNVLSSFIDEPNLQKQYISKGKSRMQYFSKKRISEEWLKVIND